MAQCACHILHAHVFPGAPLAGRGGGGNGPMRLRFLHHEALVWNPFENCIGEAGIVHLGWKKGAKAAGGRRDKGAAEHVDIGVRLF